MGCRVRTGLGTLRLPQTPPCNSHELRGQLGTPSAPYTQRRAGGTDDARRCVLTVSLSLSSLLILSLATLWLPGPRPPVCLSVSLPGLMTCRSQAVQEHASTNMGLEAIIRKALMGGGGKAKVSGRPSSRKAKSPAPGLAPGDRPPSVSSVHSEGDCNRRTPLTNRVWEDRPSSAGSTPFPYNPLIMRLQAGVMASPPPPGLAAGSGPLAGPHHAWDEEPKPLLCSQYETLSDSE